MSSEPRADGDDVSRAEPAEACEPRDLDRAAILARRAALLSSALAALSCAPSAPAIEVGVSSATATSSAASSAPVPTARPASTSKLGPWAAALTSAPPHDASPAAPAADRAALVGLDNQVSGAYAALGAAWDAVPACALDDASCDAAWTKFVALHHKIGPALEVFRPLCGWGPERSIVRQRRVAHESFLRERGAELLAHLTGLASTPAGKARLAELIEGRLVTLQPCLSCAVMPGGELADVRVAFDEGLSVLSGHEPALTQVAAHVSRPGTTRVEVRGHAASGEGGDARALAKARADAVAAELIKRGVAKARVVVTVLGDDLPVDNEARREGRVRNRRVDFELLP
jgi:outer membrane protein OmpA-like peptidoglycan-associated protein